MAKSNKEKIQDNVNNLVEQQLKIRKSLDDVKSELDDLREQKKSLNSELNNVTKLLKEAMHDLIEARKTE